MTSGRLLAIDPSLRASGWAYFEGGRLVKGGVVTTRKATPTYDCFRALGTTLTAELPGSVDVIVAEWPQVYTGAEAKGDPNDLLWLTAVLGGAMMAVQAREVQLYKPAEWKGQVDKTIHNVRVLARLTPAELAIAQGVAVTESLRHNMIDAIGIGLKYLKRLEPRRYGTSELDPSYKVQRLGARRGRT